MNYVLSITNSLSGSNDYMSAVGLEVCIDESLLPTFRPHLEALITNVKETARRESKTLDCSTVDDRIDDRAVLGEVITGPSDTYTCFSITPTHEPAHFGPDMPRRQTDWLAWLIRDQLGFCLLSLGIEVDQACPSDN